MGSKGEEYMRDWEGMGGKWDEVQSIIIVNTLGIYVCIIR